MRKRIANLGLLFAGVMAFATPAWSAPVIFDIDGGNSALSGPMGNARPFIGSDGQTDLRVTAFAAVSNAALATAYLGHYGGGLGITNSGEGTGGSNTHTMDNRGKLEFMLFAFENAIIPTSITLTPYGDPNNSSRKDSDFSAWVGTVADYSTATLAGLTLANLDTNFTRLQDNYTSSTGTRTVTNFNPNNYSGNILIIASLVVNNDSRYDYVKVKEVQGELVYVPAPAGLGLFVIGLAGALAGRSRRGARFTIS